MRDMQTAERSEDWRMYYQRSVVVLRSKHAKGHTVPLYTQKSPALIYQGRGKVTTTRRLFVEFSYH